MKKRFDFEQLVALCEQAHKDTRLAAAQAIDRSLVVRNWMFGWFISARERRPSIRPATNGREFLDRMSRALDAIGIRGCSPAYLRKCRDFYKEFAEFGRPVSDESDKSADSPQTADADPFAQSPDSAISSLSTLARQFRVGWSHYVAILGVEGTETRRFYEDEAARNGWSARELKRKIDTSLHERILLCRDDDDMRRLIVEEHVPPATASDIIMDPVVLQFLGLLVRAVHADNERAIMDRIQSYLLELDKGFLLAGRRKSFVFGDSRFVVALAMYNRLVRCYVLIDVKTGKLTRQDIRRMRTCANHFDRDMATRDGLPTVAILLRDQEDGPVVEIVLPENADHYGSQYELFLPLREELAEQLAMVRQEMEADS